jgi:hypothetical protein
MSDSYSKGISVGRLRSLEHILTEWQNLNERLGSEWARYYHDAPWWYNERASLSIFAGSVWRCPSGWAFEEFSTTKTTPSTRGKKREHTGRCDIQFGIENHEFVAEVKQCWPNIGDAHKAMKTIDLSLQRARQDCNQLAEFGCPHLAIVFAAPKLHKLKQENVEDALRQFVCELRKMRNVALAWAFPKSARDLRPDSNYNDYVFPGIVLIIQKCA